MKYVILAIILVACLGKADAQNLLSGPEGVIRDVENQRWLVACYGGNNIIAVNDQGQHSVFASNVQGALGLHLAYDTLWCTGHSPHMLIGLDIDTGERVFEMSLGSMSGSGIASDGQGALWVGSQMGQILSVNRADSTYTALCNNLPGPQGLVYDAINDQLLVACYQLNSPIYSVDIETGVSDNYAPTGLGNFIAMTGAPDGRLFLSSWRDNSVTCYTPGHDELEVIAEDLAQPAGLAIHECGSLMVIAEYGDNSLTMTPITGVGVDDVESPAANVCKVSATPNPFNPDTIVAFELATPGDTTVSIFDMRGRMTRRLFDGALESGRHSLSWDGRDDNGESVASGCYICTVVSGGASAHLKLTLLK